VRTVTTAAALIALCLVSLLFLKEPFYGYIWVLPPSGLGAVIPSTALAALRVWTFWAIATLVIGGFLLRADPGLELFDAIFAGALGTVIFAYVAGNLLGPMGLFRALTVWLALIAGIVMLARKPPRPQLHTPSSGIKLALLACVLVAVGVMPMQLGSPVPPYMDVLNNPASAQRVITFHLYLPWNNDPYGHWSPGIQTPGLELFYALLAIGSGTPLAVLAETAATLPMIFVIILAAWRLGRVLMDDEAGGFAATLLFATTIFMRGIQMRGTALAFILVAGGLAFLLDRERRPLRFALGAMILGVAFSWHAIDAAMGSMVAIAGVGFDCLEDDWRIVAREFSCLFGALLLAVPEFAVAMVIRVPYPALPAFQLAGIGLIYLAARRLPPRIGGAPPSVEWVRRGIVLAVLAVVVLVPSGIAISVWHSFAALSMLCVVGLLIAGTVGYQRATGIWIAAIALALANAAQYGVALGIRAWPDPQAQFGLNDIVYKLQEYWAPYFLVFPAAVVFSFIFRRFSRTLAITALFIFVIFPWQGHTERDINYNEHALVDQWAVNWQTAKTGWWSNSPDHRWLQSPAEFALIDKLRGEIRAGRITPATHIVHVAPESIIWKDELLYSLYLGIDDDLYLRKPDHDLNKGPTARSRMHSVIMLPAALAADPPYIAVYHQAPAWLNLPPSGYSEIFHRGEISLYRRNRVRSPESYRADPPPNSSGG
jgi:hypothetical protein